MTDLKEALLGPAAAPDRLIWLQRKETWNSDVKANSIRLIALTIFAINEWINYLVFHEVDKRFHIGSLLIIFIWLICAALFDRLLREHRFPQWGSFFMISADLLLLTWLLFLADGPRSPLVAIYFLIIGLSGLRLNPQLSLYAGGAAVFGYLSVLQFVKTQAPALAVPRSQESIMILSLFLMGIITAHSVSRELTLLRNLFEASLSTKPGEEML